MKSRKILLGSLGATLVAAAVLFVSKTDKTGQYEPRFLNSTKQTGGFSDGAFDYYDMITRDVETGEQDPEARKRARAEVDAMIASGNRSEMTFLDQGPDNIGGRTRAILIDKDDVNLIFAGSVSGGLFKSTNRGSTWRKLESYEFNYGISSMCQTANGNIYVATGHLQEDFNGSQQSGFVGDGIFVSTDKGESFSPVPGTSEGFINEVEALGNNIIYGGRDGLKFYDGSTITDFMSETGQCHALYVSPDEQVIVADIIGIGGHRTWISSDGGSTFEDVSGPEAINKLPRSGVDRMEYAISHEKLNGNYYIYASQSNSQGRLLGVWYTSNYGTTWQRIAPANDNSPGSFEVFGINGQGDYDQVLVAVKGDPEAIVFGGVEVYGKSLSGNWELRSNGFVPPLNPIYVHSDIHDLVYDQEGRLWIGTDGGVCFSDDDANTFRPSNRGYNVTQFYGISASAHGDVIGGTQDNGTLINYHDNHTYREHDQWAGGDGFTSALSFINRDIAFGTLYFGEIFRSGDRGGQVNSFNPINLNGICASGVAGLVGTGNLPFCGGFYTSIELYENPNDLNSKDTIIFNPTFNGSAGDTILIPSATSQQVIEHILTENVSFDDTLVANPSLTTLDSLVRDTTDGSDFINLYNTSWFFVTGTSPIIAGDVINVNGTEIVVDSTFVQNRYFGTNPNEPGQQFDMGNQDVLFNVAWDQIKVADPYQSWLALGLGNGLGVYLTRNALRFSATHDGFIKAGGDMVGQVTDLEFSKDGNELYVGTSAGRLYRVSGLNEIYSPNPVLGITNGNIEDSLLYYDNPATPAERFTEIASFGGAPVLGINLDRDDHDLMLVSLGGRGGAPKVQRTTNARSTTGVTFQSISGNLPSGLPCLSVLMDRENPSDILVGTEFGLFRTENGGGDWAYVESPFGKTPVFDLMQNWRSWDEGCYANGQIYVGTHGRGMWSSNEYLTVDEPQDNIQEPLAISNLSLFPNPVVNNAMVSFDTKEAGQGDIKVFNLRGQLVVDMRDLSLNAGKNNITLGLDELPAGTYIVNLTSESVSKTTKFIKQ